MNEPGKLHRRSRAATRALRAEMLVLESQGLERREIAKRLNCTPAQVTNGLGARKPWRHLRCSQDCVNAPRGTDQEKEKG